LETRLVPYSVSGNAWPAPQLVTISFVPDGTVVGNCGGSPITSNLLSSFDSKFGARSTWQNQILKAAQVWAQQTNLNFAVVGDDSANSGSGNYQQGDPNMGDIRIAGYNFGNTNLATAYMPPPVNNYSIAGDISFNTAQAYNIGLTYDLFTVAAHEFGHALGLYHSSTPCAVMYGAYNSAKSALAADDIAGVRSIYSAGNPRSHDASDASQGNNTSFSTALDLTGRLPKSQGTVSVLGGLTTTAESDYYSFLAPASSKTIFLSLQSNGLSLLSPSLSVYDANQQLLASASAPGAYGTTVSASFSVTPGARYYVLVRGADSSAFATGKYALNVGIDTAAPTAASPNTQRANGNPVSGGGGQPTKAGPESLVNTYTKDTQQLTVNNQHPVAMDANGNYVITWASQNQDGNGWGVYAQRFRGTNIIRALARQSHISPGGCCCPCPRRCPRGQAPGSRRDLVPHPTAVAAPQAAPLPLPRAQAAGRPQGPHRHPLRAQDRHPLGGPPRRDGLRLRHDVLAQAAGLATARRLVPAVSTPAHRVGGGRPDRLGPCRGR
jgi:hypothetical protein